MNNSFQNFRGNLNSILPINRYMFCCLWVHFLAWFLINCDSAWPFLAFLAYIIFSETRNWKGIWGREGRVLKSSAYSKPSSGSDSIECLLIWRLRKEGYVALTFFGCLSHATLCRSCDNSSQRQWLY